MTKRLSVTLDDEDVRTIGEFADPNSLAHEALVRWLTGQSLTISAETLSDAALLRMLVRAGAEALREQTIARGYELLAETYDEGDAPAERRAARKVYADRVDRLYDE
ncbi:hypothetical protein [Nocardioides speluncae]|uniref:hypothetical protein n=1 Tax=Nocardioides speluncae TaxID=2670337 RepID=UPI000D698EF9|nr:hypothetical protein [Nocardioides speluncae]